MQALALDLRVNFNAMVCLSDSDEVESSPPAKTRYLHIGTAPAWNASTPASGIAQSLGALQLKFLRIFRKSSTSASRG
jgi:hypothetical protein